MLGHQFFYHDLIRKHVIIVGTLFNDIAIQRTDPAADDEVTSIIKVPVQYGPKDKMLARLDSDPTANRSTPVLTLPRISFELTNMYYDGTRHLNATNFTATRNTASTSTFKHQYVPVPYNFNFVVTIIAKNNKDITKIVEQILPYFKPEWFVNVELIEDSGLIHSIPVMLEAVMPQDIYQGNFEQQRLLTWELNLTVKGYLYGPVTNKPFIKFANTTIMIPYGTEAVSNAVGNTSYDPVVRLTVQPGLTANGTATTNAAASVDITLIDVDDDYGYIVDIDDNLLSNT